MDTENRKQEIRLRAQNLMTRTNMLINLCDERIFEDMQANRCQAGMTAHQISRKMVSERKKNSFTGRMDDLIYSFRRRKN